LENKIFPLSAVYALDCTISPKGICPVLVVQQDGDQCIFITEPFRERGALVNKPGTKQNLIFKPKKLRNHPMKAAWTILQASYNFFWVTFQ